MDVRTEPDHERAAENKKWYEDKIREKQEKQQDGGAVTKFENRKIVNRTHDFVNYERLCRGEQTHVSAALFIISASRVVYWHEHLSP